MDFLISTDTELFTFLNGIHTGYFDAFMWLVTNKLSWGIMLLALLWLTFRKGWRTAAVVLAAIGLTILLADQVSSGIIKPLVQRPRPSHTDELASTIHLINGYRGGAYGFVSSHAANHFGVAMLMTLFFRNRFATAVLMLWAFLACYSRIYLGVHYPGDILCGAIVGLVAGYAVYRLTTWPGTKKPLLTVDFETADAQMFAAAVIANVATLAGLACFITVT